MYLIYSQSNSQTKHFNQVLAIYLQAFSNNKQANSYKILSIVDNIYNNIVHLTIEVSSSYPN